MAKGLDKSKLSKKWRHDSAIVHENHMLEAAMRERTTAWFSDYYADLHSPDHEISTNNRSKYLLRQWDEWCRQQREGNHEG